MNQVKDLQKETQPKNAEFKPNCFDDGLPECMGDFQGDGVEVCDWCEFQSDCRNGLDPCDFCDFAGECYYPRRNDDE
jgi:hypothetical protein